MVDRNDSRNEEKRCAQVAVESVITWGEAAGVADISQDMARAIAADVTYRLRQSLNVCGQFLRHCKRRKLTPDDVNRALKWMDITSIMGYTGSEPVEWQGIPEVGVHIPHDPTVNLASTALSGDIFHQPGSPCVRGEWAYISGHTMVKGEGGGESVPAPLPLSPEHHQYYQMLFTVIAGPSNDLFKIMCEDVSTSPGINSVVGPIVGGIVRGAQRARQKPCILRRILLIIRALLLNPHLYLGPQNYMRDIINVLVYCIIIERKTPQDTQTIRSLACNVLIQVVSREPGSRGTWETVVSSLGGVVASSSRPWGQHVGALIGLLTLGCHSLLNSLTPIARPYYNRLTHAISQSPGASTRDILDAHTSNCLLLAGLVNVMTTFVRSLPDNIVMFSSSKESSQSTINAISPTGIGDGEVTFEQIQEIYKLGEESYGSAFIVQIPTVYLCCTPNQVPSFLQSSVYRDQAISGDALLNPPATKRSRSKSHHSTKPKSRRSQPYPLSQVFDGYKALSDNRSHMQMNIRGCWEKNINKLKKRESSLPTVIPHAHRPLLARWSRLTGCMPHNTFTRPLYAPLKPGHTLQYLLL
ncbi:TAF6-like RNA polymerase II p300/CBP-associated factor-associated factor 65 kDa subunit 6L [Homarus americanus]|uniref:TAF6-like RNA polymerase II p300/CBP-associated factor-associated factor 65 kDa subunit 6L-like n=1 Tax=Homarus americanus TaxID=6706 RepID=A0A8J5MMU1_HOMAM|nr:TAF6-like RNA polymerase II p300/CBP-associated factor-associated factor 65 kDa subunit 6L [Homarus americanus]KAG7156937.1 TAF6-like RNA polymerase II p300/CBP-associated factor-associated factor 65 kDa subunit 6L-like [Homarus americanus]